MSWLDDNYDKVFKKYGLSELTDELSSFSAGGKVLNKTLEHFFKEVMFKARRSKFKLTPMEFLSDDELIAERIEYIKNKRNFYPESDGMVTNIEKSLHNKGTHTWKVANFRPDVARDVYHKIAPIGSVIYDYSCGWGSRMLAALLSGYDYFGTDPNTELHKQLISCAEFLKSRDVLNKFDIRCSGSEVLHEDWIGKVDACFSSPPYFDMEIYAEGEETQSTHNRNYNQWIKEYMLKTIFNCDKYLKVGGYFCMNIKDQPTSKLFLYSHIEKLIDLMISKGSLKWEKQDPIQIKIGTKKNYTMHTGIDINSDMELAMLYKKIGDVDD